MRVADGASKRIIQSRRVDDDLSIVNGPDGVKGDCHVSSPLDVDDQEWVGAGADVAHRAKGGAPLLDEDLVTEVDVRHLESRHDGRGR